jgi:hypothetical protein
MLIRRWSTHLRRATATLGLIAAQAPTASAQVLRDSSLAACLSGPQEFPARSATLGNQ